MSAGPVSQTGPCWRCAACDVRRALGDARGPARNATTRGLAGLLPLPSLRQHTREGPGNKSNGSPQPSPKKGKTQKESAQDRCFRCRVSCPPFRVLVARYLPVLPLAPGRASCQVPTTPPPVLRNPATRHESAANWMRSEGPSEALGLYFAEGDVESRTTVPAIGMIAGKREWFPESHLENSGKLNVVESDPARLRESVRVAYSRAASNPGEEHPFPVGAEFALSLGYPREILDTMPNTAIGGFTGVSNVSVFATLPAGGTVVDLGCGSELDSLIAAQRVGAEGRVVGIDFSEPMLDRANSSLRELGLANVMFLRSAAEQLPLADACVGQALVNGIFNLNPFRDEIFSELARIVKPGGSVFGAELILHASLQGTSLAGAANWFS